MSEDFIEKIEVELAAKQSELDVLKKAKEKFSSLKKHVNRWNAVRYYTEEVNSLVTDYESRHNCGCCPDSPLEVWPYIEYEGMKIYSDPIPFMVGEKCGYGDSPYPDWDKKMREKDIPEEIIKRVSLVLTDRDKLLDEYYEDD